MQNIPVLPLPTRRAILKRFLIFYTFLALFFITLTIMILAWKWNQPTKYYLGFSYTQSVPILLIASLFANGISFYFQNLYLSALLQQPNIIAQFRLIPFSLRFYLYNFFTSIVLSLIFFFPLLNLLFFFWIYPIISWLLPYQILMGLILGREIKRYLLTFTPSSQHSDRH